MIGPLTAGIALGLLLLAVRVLAKKSGRRVAGRHNSRTTRAVPAGVGAEYLPPLVVPRRPEGDPADGRPERGF